MTITQQVEIDLDDIDVEEVLDEMDIDNIEDYLEKRKGELTKRVDKTDNEKYFILMACEGHLSRNVSPTKKDVKEAINNIIDMVFSS